MRDLLTVGLVSVLAASTATAATLSDSLVTALSTNPTATQRVIVTMKDAPGAKAHIAGLDRDRAAVKEALQQNAALSQADLLADLDAMGVDGGANVRTNWLANAIVLDATPDQIAALEQREDVRVVELNETIQLDPYIQTVTPGKLATGDDEVSTWGLKATKALEARQTYAVDGTGVLVGILDTGFDNNHPLLNGKVASWKSFISDDQTDPIDDNGHGSHCAGTIGGSSGGAMEIGMAPGVKFVVGKILSGSGSGSWEGVMNGMAWVVDPDGEPNSGDEPKLVSNSWGGSRGSDALHQATKAWLELGVAPIFAAGNSGPGSSTVGYPGGYLEAYAVGATAVDNSIASFSSRGPVTHDGVQHIKPEISAPGKDVTSVKAGGQYWTISGTSMATPHVAGMSALLLQANPDLSYEQLFEVINSTSIDEGSAGQDNDFGHGRIDAMAALSIVISGGKIVGSVKDADGNGVSHAKLVINETGTQVRLAADGSFRMTLPEGEYTMSVSAFGFVAGSVSDVTVAAGEETQVNVSMERAASGTVKGNLTGTGTAIQGKLVVLDTPLAAVDTDANGAFSISLPAGNYSIAADAYGFEPGTSAEFTVNADAETEITLDLAGLPPVLVIDDDAGKSYEGFYSAALGDKAHKVLGYDQLTSLSGEYLAQYEVVVWFTGDDYRSTFNAGDQAALTEYLSAGGRLFVSGQEVAYQLKGKEWLQNTLGAKFSKDSSGSKAVEAFGLSFAIEGGDGANNQKYPDAIEANGGEMIATYANGMGAGVKFANGNGKVVYLSFGLEGVDSAANRAALMNAAIDYLSPSAEEMAARIDALAAMGTVDSDAAALALTDLVSTRVASEGAELSGSASRELRRMGSFLGLHQ